MRGVQVGKVASIESLPNGQAGHPPGDGPVAVALHSRQRARRHRVVDGVRREVRPAGGTRRALGAAAAQPARRCRASTSWSKSTRCSSNWCRFWPRSTRRNSTRHSVRWRQAFSGRGAKLGQALSDLDSFLAKLEPSLPAFSHDLAVLPVVSNAYADAAPDLVKTAANATRISKTIVDEQHNLDALLISAIGLADIGNDVLSAQPPATDGCAASAGADHRSDQRVPRGAHLRFRRARALCRTVPPLSEPSINISAEPHAGAPNVIGIRRTCPRLRRRAARSAWVCRRCRSTRTRRNWSPISAPTRWEYGNPQLLLNFDGLKAAAVRADRRPAAQPRPDRTTGMRTRATLIKFGDLRGRDGGADRVPVLHLRPVPDRFDDRVFGSVRRRVASEGRGSRCGSPGSGWARSTAFRCSRTRKLW